MIRKATLSTPRRPLQLESLEIRQTMTGNGWGGDIPSTPSPIVATVLTPNIALQTSNSDILKSSLGKSVVDPAVIVERLIAEENARAINVKVEGDSILIQGTEDDDRITVSDLPDGKVLIEIQSFPTSGKGINQRFVAQVRRDTGLFGSLAQLNSSVISINAKGGNDTVTTRTTVPLLAWGGEGNDLLESTLGESTFFGENGNDTLLGSPQNDVLHGDAGDDTIIGNGGSDILYGDEGHNRLEGGSGHDTLNARGGYGDVLVGGDNDDTLIGSLYADELYGGDGKDILEGRDGNDLLVGDAGEDTLDGGDGNDQIFGGSENDAIYGGAGNDELFGDDGLDWLLGGIGNDILDGGADAYRDNLVGGTGVDYFFGNYATVREKTSTLLGSKSERSFYEIKENLVDPLPGDVWQYAIMDKVTSGSVTGTFVYMASPWDYLKQARVKIQG